MLKERVAGVRGILHAQSGDLDGAAADIVAMPTYRGDEIHDMATCDPCKKYAQQMQGVEEDRLQVKTALRMFSSAQALDDEIRDSSKPLPDEERTSLQIVVCVCLRLREVPQRSTIFR